MEKPAQTILVALLLSIPVVLSSQSSSSPGGTGWIPVGVILDTGTLVGKICRTSISMAVEDFYAEHANYTTRLVPHTRDGNADVVGAADAAIDLLGNVHVEAIIGPQTSVQAVFISQLGNQTRVPIISFSATSPSLSSVNTPYFVRTASNDPSQANVISSLVKAFGWREVVLIYEDSNFGAGVVPYLIDALQAVDARVPYRSVMSISASNDQIQKELYKLMTMQTRVFLVHMSPSMGARVFLKAKEVGMMNRGYAWIVTDSITGELDGFDSTVLDSMQGLLGVRHYVPPSSELDDFTVRWERRFRQANPDDRKVELNIYGLWAYDTVWALALATEHVGIMAPDQFVKPQNVNASTDLESLGVSQIGPMLLEAISKQEFVGLSGKFRLVDGQLQSSVFQIVNVVGARGGREVGFWTPSHGLSRRLTSITYKDSPSASITDLGAIIWPGDSTSVPKGWEMPTSGKKLRIGVPLKDGFGEFVRVDQDPLTNRVTVSGYCIDVFEAVMQALPYAISYEYIPFENATRQVAGTYNDLVYQVYLQKYDAVVGDISIRYNRSLYVDFTLPFTESGMAMIVPVKEDPNTNAWIFLKPLTVDLWLISMVFFFYTGIVVWVIEHRISEEFRGPVPRQLGVIFYFSFSTLVFAHKERIESNLSKLVVIMWLFVVLILTSSYTASLTSMLTVQKLQPTVTSVQQLQKDGDYVGFHQGSFMDGLLIELGFDRSKLRPLDMPDDYVDALAKGTSNGGVAAIFHEVPYIKLFLSQHCTGYTMVGLTQKTAGFGFVFPKNSPLVPDISKAILNVTEGELMVKIETKWFGDQTTCLNQGSTVSSNNLSFRSFWGLFLITGATSTSALFIFLIVFLYKNWHELNAMAAGEPFWQKLAAWFKFYNQRDTNSCTFREDRPGDAEENKHVAVESTQGGEVIPDGASSRSPASISNLSDMDWSSPNQETSPQQPVN
uniref:Glutamate receptor n=1 Tax=Anthurium amnicola TaxID=1678845 RepID=A0A1D1Y7C4_9ARAE